MQSIDISGFKSGAHKKDKKPFLLVDDAFQELQNAYVWREELKKREGMQFIGRYRRVFASASIGVSGASPWTINTLYSNYVPAIIPEATAEIEPGSVIVVIGAITFTDQGNGLLTSLTLGNNGWIDYTTGIMILTHTAGAGVAATAAFNYFPTLPAMGIDVREIPGINDEQTLWFDTKYCYVNSGGDFQEFLSPSVTWDGTDSDFFWATNYRGSDSSQRLFFVTNFVADAGSPMRYTDGATWTDFKPIVGGTPQTNILTAFLAGGSGAFGPAFLTDLPIVKGTVVITVSNNEATENDVVFRDTLKDGTLVSSGLNSGTINYATGEINLTFNPVLPGTGTWTVTGVYNQAGTFLFTARILIPYYGRLLALNTIEGIDIGTAQNFFSRCRFAQIGNPIQQDSWRSDVFGKGGFVDAPTNEEIISATFYKNTLIVQFERSTWRLQYIGEYGIPFIWERISSDFGSESTFSPVLFDNGVLAVADKAIVGSSGSDVQRIDIDIPDVVYDFLNTNDGPKRVQGIRDFKKELVYWCYPDVNTLQDGQYFPNFSLLYNYRNNTYAFFRNNVTCFGNFQYAVDITWDRFDVFWDSYQVTWDSTGQSKMPLIVSGNQQGFAHFYGYPDVESLADSSIDALDQESLSVTDVAVNSGVDVVLEILKHNLLNAEIIYLVGLNYVVTTSPPSAGSTTLNDQIYRIQYVDINHVRLFKWIPLQQEFAQNFPVTNIGDYVGGGLIALFPRMNIETKDFNPAKQMGQNIVSNAIDFLFDVSVPSPINVKLKMNTTLTAQANLLVGNQNVETANSKTGFIENITLTNPCVITSTQHGLLTGDEVSPQEIEGTVQLNGNNYTTTFIDMNNFSLNVDSTLFTAYIQGGYWAQSLQQYFTLSAQYAWHRFFANAYGQYMSIILTYSDEQMAQLSTHQQNFVLNAMKVYFRPAGTNIFGK